MKRLIEVVEVDPFPTQAASVWSDAERHAFIDFIAAFPDAGVVIPGLGGLRKVRWSREGGGKRGGARVVYFFFDRESPLLLIGVFAKARQSDLAPAQKRKLQSLAAALKAAAKARKRPA